MKYRKPLCLLLLALNLVLTLVPAAVYKAAPLSPEPGSSPESPSSQEESGSRETSSREASSRETSSPEETASQESASESPAPSLPGPLDNQKESPAEAGFILRDADGESFTVPEREFLTAVLLCEMDPGAPQEALKAQVVASYTYYLRQRESGQAIDCDSENWLVYVPEAQIRERWGDQAEEILSQLGGIVDAVYGERLTYQGETALTSYFAISPGSTEWAGNVWSAGADETHPYLQAVASPGDSFSDGYLSTPAFSAESFREAVLAYFTEDPPDLSGPTESWLSDPEYTPSGTVKTVTLGGKTVSGPEMRAALGLRSAAFTWEVSREASGEELRFTVKGWGHGVGMSQAGAVFLAKRGADYREILGHYYPGTALTNGENVV